MKPQIKFGLLVGVVSLVLNTCVASVLGVCGPFVALLAGAVAGFFAAQQEKAATKSDGARSGVIAGLIAGALTLIGQLIGGIGALAFVQFSDMTTPFGNVPSPSADASQQILYYVSGLGTGLCFGIVGIVLAALAGAGAGYLGTPTEVMPPHTDAPIDY